MRVTVIIVTLNRPDCVRTCLRRLEEQEYSAEQVIVVDASPDEETRRVVEQFTTVQYIRNSNGFGRMTASRNIGLRSANGDVIAFLDDDSFAHASWLGHLLTTYKEADVGAVGGRALNGQPGEADLGVAEIGHFKSNGVLTGNFAADPGRIVEVDHVMGCNMSFRREVLAALGGFRTDYPGISGIREDSDMCLRVKHLGYRILFNPAAVVDHLGAPQMKGKRFDTRYAYFVSRNHMVLLIRNFGLLSRLVWRYQSVAAINAVGEFVRRIGGAFARFGAIAIGTIVGFWSGVCILLSVGRDPIRRDAQADEIRCALRCQSTEPAHARSETGEPSPLVAET